MREFFSIAETVLQPGQALVFSSAEPCTRGLIRYREGTGEFLLAGVSDYRGCVCRRPMSTDYFVDFHANVAVPADGTAGEVQLGFAVDGTVLPATVMRATPAAVNEYFNVGRSTNVPIWCGCCQSFSVVNSGTVPVAVQEANLVIDHD